VARSTSGRDIEVAGPPVSADRMSTTTPTTTDLTGSAAAADSTFAVLGPDEPVRIIPPDVIDRETRRMFAETKAAQLRLNTSAIGMNAVSARLAVAKLRRAALDLDPANWRRVNEQQAWIEILERYATIAADALRTMTASAARAEAARIAGVIT
jgi:hypothetical protein